MNEPKPFNSWTQISLAMGVVFTCAGLWWLVSGGMNAAAVAMFVLGLHSFVAAFMYYRWPQFASNASNLTQFVNNSRLTLIWIGFFFMDAFRLSDSPYMNLLVIAAALAFGYMSVRALLGFLKEIR